LQFEKEDTPLEQVQLQKSSNRGLRGVYPERKRGTIREGGHTVGAGAVTEILE